MKKFLSIIAALCLISNCLNSFVLADDAPAVDDSTIKYDVVDLSKAQFSGTDPYTSTSYKVGTPKYKLAFKNYGCQNAFDGDVNTSYYSLTNANRKYVEVELPTSDIEVDAIGIIPRKNSSVAYSDKLEIYGSTRAMGGNLKNATLLATVEGIGKTDGTMYTFEVDTKGKQYNHYMVLARNINYQSSNNAYVMMQLAEVKLLTYNPDFDPATTKPTTEQINVDVASKNITGEGMSVNFKQPVTDNLKAGVVTETGEYKLSDLPFISEGVNINILLKRADNDDSFVLFDAD